MVLKTKFLNQKLLLPLSFALALGTVSCEQFAPSPNETYAPHSEGYVNYVNNFTGTDTHVFEKGDRSFVLRGTPPFAAMITPWYDWRDISAEANKTTAIGDCGSCGLPAGAEADVRSRNLAGYKVHLELCYMNDAKAPVCFKGDPMAIESNNAEAWKKLTVNVPLEDFKAQHFTRANMRLAVEGRPAVDNNTFSEGVIWADDFHYQVAEADRKTGEITMKRSGALWPDDYSGWREYHNNWATGDDHLIPNGVNK